MAWRQAKAGVIASMAPSSFPEIGIIPAAGINRLLIMVWGGVTAGPGIAAAYLNGAFDAAAYADNGDRLFTFNAGSAVSPVGLTRTNCIALLWFPGRAGTGIIGTLPAVGGWPFPSMEIRLGANATAGTTTAINYEIWVDDNNLGVSSQSSL